MNAVIIPVLSTDKFSNLDEFISLADEEQQLAIDEQLMLDREAYAHGSEY